LRVSGPRVIRVAFILQIQNPIGGSGSGTLIVMPTQLEIADHLDISERRVRDVLKALALDWTVLTMDDIRLAYIRDLREKSAGRGGNDQVNLTRARADQAVVDTALKSLQYNREIGSVIDASDAEDVLGRWSGYANREYISGLSRLISEIESRYKISVDNKLVEDIAGPTVERIKDHAQELGRDLIESIDEVLATENGTDG